MRVPHPALRRRWCRVTGFEPHPGQAPILLRRERNLGIVAGVRFGKSRLAGQILSADCVVPGAYGWAVGPTYDLADKVFREVWKAYQAAGIIGRGSSYSKGRLVTVGGSVVERKSADNPDSLIGEGLSSLVIDEAARMKSRVLFRELLPRLSDRRGRLTLITSPAGRDWIYELHEAWRRGEEPDWWWCHAPTWLNTVTYPGGAANPEIVRMQAAYDKAGLRDYWDQEFGAEFTVIAGRIFRVYDPKIHLVGDAEARAGVVQWWLGYDWGWDHLTAWELVGRTGDGQWRAVDEWTGRGNTPAEILAAAFDLLKHNRLTPGDLDAVYCDPSRPEQIRMFGAAGLPAIGAARVRGPETRVPYIAHALASGGRINRDRVRVLPVEIEGYRHLEDSPSGRLVVVKKRDDTVDALGYVIASVETAEVDNSGHGGIEDDF